MTLCDVANWLAPAHTRASRRDACTHMSLCLLQLAVLYPRGFSPAFVCAIANPVRPSRSRTSYRRNLSLRCPPCCLCQQARAGMESSDVPRALKLPLSLGGARVSPFAGADLAMSGGLMPILMQALRHLLCRCHRRRRARLRSINRQIAYRCPRA
ncbi:hypothetical protein FA95DRAFT_1016242 [Auriscalpium vulgare]|uniref:Uncharacterized protein n=1 Tax=Auriscalpium vulgare TaxID=40419 RepID=A0ACB8RYI2_9AGAM|nr:hypothetical protein FA95DRAFT_1016242 [Auriscalpium vulgare]